MSHKLFTQAEIEAGYYLRFVVDSILRSDQKTRYEGYRIGIQGSFLTPNEVRAWEELPPHPGGDDLLVNQAMVPLSSIAGARGAKKNAGNQPEE